MIRHHMVGDIMFCHEQTTDIERDIESFPWLHRQIKNFGFARLSNLSRPYEH